MLLFTSSYHDSLGLRTEILFEITAANIMQRSKNLNQEFLLNEDEFPRTFPLIGIMQCKHLRDEHIFELKL